MKNRHDDVSEQDVTRRSSSDTPGERNLDRDTEFGESRRYSGSDRSSSRDESIGSNLGRSTDDRPSRSRSDRSDVERDSSSDRNRGGMKDEM